MTQPSPNRGGRPEIGPPTPIRLGHLQPKVDAWRAKHGLKRSRAVRELLARVLGDGSYWQELPDQELAQMVLGYGAGGHEGVEAEVERRWPYLAGWKHAADRLLELHAERWRREHPEEADLASVVGPDDVPFGYDELAAAYHQGVERIAAGGHARGLGEPAPEQSTAWLVPNRDNAALLVCVSGVGEDGPTSSRVTVEVERIAFADVLRLRNDQDWLPAWERWTTTATRLLAEQGWEVWKWTNSWPTAVAIAAVTRR